MAWLGVDCLKVGASGSGYIDHLATARVTVGASRCDPNATVAKCLQVVHRRKSVLIAESNSL